MAFPSTPIHGKLARVTKAGTIVDYSSRWSINWTKDAAVFGRQAQEYKEAAPGQAGWTGSAEFFFVNAAEQGEVLAYAIGTSSTPTLSTTHNSSGLLFCFDTTVNKLQGNIIVTGLTIDAPVGDMIRASFTFQGSGPIKFVDA